MSSQPVPSALDVRTRAFPILTAAQINRVRPGSKLREVKKGEVLFEPGDTNVPFFVLLSGSMEIVQPDLTGERPIVTHGKQRRNIVKVRLTPDNGGSYGNLAYCLLALQRFDEARQTIEQAHSRKLDGWLSRNALYALAFLHDDSSAMAEQQQWFAGKRSENMGLSLASDTEAYAGHLGKARELTKRSVDSANRADSKESGAIWLEIAAQREAAFGNPSNAKQAAAEGLKLYPASQGVEVEARAHDCRKYASSWARLHFRQAPSTTGSPAVSF